MKILVTGATSGLGLTACERLLGWGMQVHGVARDPAKAAHLFSEGLEFHSLDLTTAQQPLAQALKGVDAVWHCAALSSSWGDPQDFYLNNVQATQNLLRASVTAGVRKFVLVSTAAVYFDYRDRLAVRECFLPKDFANSCARTKRMSELLVSAAAQDNRGALKTVVLRPRGLFGPRDRGVIPLLMQSAWRNGGKLPLPRGGKVLLDMTYMDNMVDAMWLATVTPGLADYETFNISNDDPWMFDKLLTRMAQGLVSPFAIKPVSHSLRVGSAFLREAWSGLRGREPSITRYGVGSLSYHQTLDISLARQRLGYRPAVSMEDGVSRTLAALQGQEVD